MPDPSKKEQETMLWSFAICSSLCISLILCFVWRSTQSKYNRKITRNKCTPLPYLILIFSLLSLELKLVIEQFFDFECELSKRTFEYSLGSFACIFFTTGIMV
jgi:hypothetical protein